MKRFPVLWFYLLAFALAWLGWLPIVLGSRGLAFFAHPAFQMLLLLPAAAPALAAAIVTRAEGGAAALRALFGALLKWRVGLFWFLAALLGPLALLLGAQALTRLLSLPTTGAPPQMEPVALFISALVMALLANPWEEVGWRGFAQPRLQQRLPAWQATLVVGLLWGLWHIPLFFWVGNPMAEYPFLAWFAGAAASAYIYAWLYNGSGRSLLIPAIFHVALNTFGALVPGVSIYAMLFFYLVAAAVILLRTWHDPTHSLPRP